MKNFVDAKYVQERLKTNDLKILDASWYLPFMKRDGVAEFQSERIPTSQFFEIDGVADMTKNLPHMLPSEQQFDNALSHLGIDIDKNEVIIYDRMGLFSAPRAWWTFKVFGVEKVKILEGGYPLWQQLGYDIDRTPLTKEEVLKATTASQNYSPTAEIKQKLKKNIKQVRNLEQILSNIDSEKEIVLDARSQDRFDGLAPEPRPIPSGHIPGSVCVPFASLIDQGRYKDPTQLKDIFKKAGLDVENVSKDVIVTCGSGSTACVLALALDELNFKNYAIYDGAWAEYGALEHTNKITQAK